MVGEGRQSDESELQMMGPPLVSAHVHSEVLPDTGASGEAEVYQELFGLMRDYNIRRLARSNAILDGTEGPYGSKAKL